jgi:hypothetical protein
MRISASQNMFRPIFQVIYHKIFTYIYCGEVATFWGYFMYFWGILGDFLAKNFRGFLTKIWSFRGFFFQFELATLLYTKNYKKDGSKNKNALIRHKYIENAYRG